MDRISLQPKPRLRATAVGLVLILAACGGAASVSPSGSGSAPGSVAASPSGDPGTMADIPMYRMDPTHTGIQPGPGPEGTPQLVWAVQARPFVTSPVIGAGVLFIGDGNGDLYALDARTGATRWQLALGAPAASAPVYGDGIVAVTDQSGVLHGVDAASGEEQWATAPILTATAPILVDGTIYTTGNDRHAHGFDVATGDETWSWEAGVDLGGGVAMDGDLLLATATDGSVHAVSLSAKTETWSFATIAQPGVPIIAGDVVLENSLQASGEPTGELYGLDRATGRLLWRFRGPSGLQVSLGSVRDGILYAPSESDGTYAFRISDGTQVWHADGPRVFFGTALVGDTLYVSAESPNEIAAISVADGSVIWALPTLGIPKGNPLVTGGMVFGTDDAGYIRAFGSNAGGTSAPTPRQLATPSATPAAANPFTVTARYDAATLGLDRPIAMAIGPNGHAYITETPGRVTEISADGSVVRRFGSPGSGPGQFTFTAPNPEDGPHGSIAVGPDGKVYVSDFRNHRVEVFTADGAFVRQFGTFGTGPGQFLSPFDVGVGPDGTVYVTDDEALTLSKFGPDGAFLWTRSGSDDPELKGHMHGAMVDSAGRVVIGIDDTGDVILLDPDGNVVDSFAAVACAVSVDADDHVYIGHAGCGGSGMDVRTEAGDLIGQWSGTDAPFADTIVFGPDGLAMALDPVGAVLVLEVNLPGE